LDRQLRAIGSLHRTFDPLGASELQGARVVLRPPQPSDHAAWAALREDSRDFLEPWEPSWSAETLSRASFRRRLRRYARDLRDDNGIALLIFRKDDGALVGGITLSNIRRGVTQTCSVGYWIGERFARQGYMSDALNTVIRFVFEGLRLHRLEAACVPDNVASGAVLAKCGFVVEGSARKYLCINGTWRDHMLFAILATDPRPGAKTAPEISLAHSA
jgi:ribosomal-protein-alanine N-acetyltransferase